jgi:DNA invertase Pin-like site-specific DNA recombinase
VSDLAEFELRELERRVHWALDQFEARLSALERYLPVARYSLAGGVAQRRAVVVELRESGLSIPQIAAATGASLATVQRDLDVTPHHAPRYVKGLDQKMHPTSKNGKRAEA